MSKMLSCEFNIDTGNVELRYADSTIISINCTEVENEVAKNINARSELDWLVYNAPLDYAELVLCGNLEGYLRQVSGPHSGIEGNSYFYNMCEKC
ncbi:MAG: hypothetical protein HFE91_01490 [Acutalibacter sp.]|jgi:hypothetical protein|uniref:DUF6061 family protein n=1 Tax=Acutalibacter sp. TaxID=1918636 RepID=UPI00216C0C3B|nr:DUF6061 family protein [Acutalibacter sp.]MCI9224124.1 hypothetical protein [Acutalibacter sp.]